MDPNKKRSKEDELRQGEQSQENKNISEAHHQADMDMEDDAEFTAHSKNDDLDEGETARLGENPNGI